jgi:hypothetical protein
MQAIRLSESAQALLRHRLATKDGTVTPENLPAYRELAEAGIMMPLSGFAGGRVDRFLFTDEGWARREEFLSDPAPRP